MRAVPQNKNSGSMSASEGQRVIWIVRDDGARASTRLQAILIDRYLQDHGWLSGLFVYGQYKRGIPKDVLADSLEPIARSGDIVVFHKLGGIDIETAIARLADRGIKTVYVEPDFRPNETAKLMCDNIVVPSKALAATLADQFAPKRIHCIPDPIESSREPVFYNSGRSYRLVWVGDQSNWYTLDVLHRVLAAAEFQDIELTTISDHPEASHEWSISTVFDLWRSGDVAVIPTGDSTAAQCKSSNRLTQSWAFGIPVICGNIPAYRDLIDEGVNGFICQDEADFRRALRALRDPQRRQAMGRQGHTIATEKFSIDHITSLWKQIFCEIVGVQENGFRGSIQEQSHLSESLCRWESEMIDCVTRIRTRGTLTKAWFLARSIMRRPLKIESYALAVSAVARKLRLN